MGAWDLMGHLLAALKRLGRPAPSAVGMTWPRTAGMGPVIL